MNNLDLVVLGTRNLFRRKLRTFLTVIGVLIGTAAIVVMISLGYGLEQSYMKDLEQWGSLNIIDVYPGYGGNTGREFSSGGMVEIDDMKLRAIRGLDNVVAVQYYKSMYVKLVSGRYEAHISINGVNLDSLEHFDFVLSEGRLLTSDDRMSFVFGGQVAYNFYNPKSHNMWGERIALVDPIKDRIILELGYSEDGSPKKTHRLNVVGVLVEGNDWFKDYNVFTTIETVEVLKREQRRLEGNQGPQKDEGYQSIKVKVKDVKHVEKVQEEIKSLGLEAYSMMDALKFVKETTNTIQAVLGGIAAVSLLVAAIGITNTMIMSIYERTKEIGVMKVIGASVSDIRRLFLYEAALLGLLGGTFGVGLSYLASKIINSMGLSFAGSSGDLSVIHPVLALSALGFSVGIGLISGLYPAIRATKLSALEAIRTE